METFGVWIFLGVVGMAFWMLIFLFGILVPGWITLGMLEWWKPELAAKLIGVEYEEDEDEDED